MITYRLAIVLGICWITLAATRLNAQDDSYQADENILQEANLPTDEESLLAFFQKRTLSDTDAVLVEATIQELGHDSFRIREQASAKLCAKGPGTLTLLQQYFDHSDLELAERAKKCARKIRLNDHEPLVTAAAVRLLRDRKPAGAVKVLLAYLPFADQDVVIQEVRKTLAALALIDGTTDPELVKGLKHKKAVIRAAAGEALALAKDKTHENAVWKLLEDPVPVVRFRVAVALARTEHRKAIPVIINLLPHLSQVHAWQAEDVLLQLAQGHKEVPTVTVGESKAARVKCRDDWLKWWKDYSNKVDLARLQSGPNLRGYTVVVLLDAGQILELGKSNEIRWQLSNINFPLDVQVLDNDRVLIAEYHGSRVTERDLKGQVKWQYRIFGPLVAQRLKNGNTFIATDKELIEVNKDGNRVFQHSFGNERIMKAAKLPNGNIVCLTDAIRVVVMNGQKKIIREFRIVLGKRLFGGRIHVTPAGRILVPHNQENKVIEYDKKGRKVWDLNVKEPIAAIRLPNGNTLVTTMAKPGVATEYNRAGNAVWSYETKINSRITRAKRR